MFAQELQAAAAAKGWKVNAQTGAVTGVCDGVAFRATAEDGMTLELSASIGEKTVSQAGGQVRAVISGRRSAATGFRRADSRPFRSRHRGSVPLPDRHRGQSCGVPHRGGARRQI